jgi:hypothetical protein
MAVHLFIIENIASKSGNYEIITNAAKCEDEGKRVLNICMDF